MAQPSMAIWPLRVARVAWSNDALVRAALTPAGIVTTAGGLLIVLLATAAGLHLAGIGQPWQDAEWFVAVMTATVASALGARDATGRERKVRAWLAIGIAMFAIGQALAGLASLIEPQAAGGWADLLRFAAAIPAVGALRAMMVGRLRRTEEIAVYLDSIAVLGTTVAVGCVAIGSIAADVGGAAGLLLLAYPLLFVGMSGAALVGALALRVEFQPRGAYAVVAGYGLIGLAMVAWLGPAGGGEGAVNAPLGLLFSAGLLIVGIGGATWSERADAGPTYIRWTKRLQMAITLGSVAVTGGLVLVDEVAVDPRVFPLFMTAVAVTLMAAIARQTALLVDRGTMVAELELLHGQTQAALEETRRVQTQLLAASKRAAVGELAGAVAHEVNNPLTGVLGYAELLLAEAAPDDPSREELEIIRNEALRARDIVRSLLEFSRPRAPERRMTDLGALVRGTLDLTRYHLERGGLRLTERYDPMTDIDIDPDAVRQAVLNVVTNAVEAMPADGALDVRVTLDGSEAVITVRDAGHGMDEATRLKAFQPFFSTRAAEQGTGLGLSAAQTLIEAHGGRIELTSEPGRGTTVEIRLPRTAPEESANDPAALAAGPLRATGMSA